MNLKGRISIVKSLPLPKMTHLAIVLPELDAQIATKTEKLTLNFIWKTFDEQPHKNQVRMNKKRS